MNKALFALPREDALCRADIRIWHKNDKAYSFLNARSFDSLLGTLWLE